MRPSHNLYSGKQPSLTGEARGFLSWMLAISRAFSLSVEVFLRHSFGARYLSVSWLIGTFLLMILYFLFEGGPDDPVDPWQTLLITVFILAFVGCSIFHKGVILYRRSKGDVWHSWYPGESWALWHKIPLSEETIHAFVQPAACLLFGLTLGGPVGNYLAVAGFFFFLKERLTYFEHRRFHADVQDSRIEAQNISHATPRAHAKNATHIAKRPDLAPPPPISANEAIKALDPKLKMLLKEDSDQSHS